MHTYVMTQDKRPPRLAHFLSAETLDDLPDWATHPRGSPDEVYAALHAMGIEGIQGGDPALCRKHGLMRMGIARINTPDESLPMIQQQAEKDSVAFTCHLAWGMEEDAFVDELLQSVMEASQQTGLPVFPEIHRATIFQDCFRTVKALERHPALRLTADFSHWYTGQEFHYGDWADKMDFIEPVFSRISHMHGRIGNPSHIQVKIDGTEVYVDHFRDLWTRTLRAFRQQAPDGAIFPFTPEILRPAMFYARTFPVNGEMREESDRWQQALLYYEIIDACWQAAASH